MVATKEATRVQQLPVDAQKLILQLKSMDPNFVRSALREAGVLKGINRQASIAHVWSRDKNVAAGIAKLLSANYTVGEPKASKKGDSFRVQILSAK